MYAKKNVRLNVKDMIVRHLNTHRRVAGQKAAQRNHKKLMRNLVFGPFSHRCTTVIRPRADTILLLSDSPVCVYPKSICSVMFRFFAFEILVVKVQEKSAEHRAEIFITLFLHFGYMLHGPIQASCPGDHIFNTSLMYTIAYAVAAEIDTVSAAPARSKVALR